MLTSASRALTVVLLAVLATLLAPVAPVSAAPQPTCPTPTVQASAKAARAIFTGAVTSVAASGTSFVHEVAVSRVYRGSISTSTVQVQTNPRGRCSLGQLARGQAYVFFVRADGSPWVAANGGGTAPATSALVAEVETRLGAGRPPVPPAPEEAEFTPVGPSDPAGFSRVAAPGLAMILVGLLGLVVVRGLGRRRG